MTQNESLQSVASVVKLWVHVAVCRVLKLQVHTLVPSVTGAEVVTTAYQCFRRKMVEGNLNFPNTLSTNLSTINSKGHP